MLITPRSVIRVVLAAQPFFFLLYLLAFLKIRLHHDATSWHLSYRWSTSAPEVDALPDSPPVARHGDLPNHRQISFPKPSKSPQSPTTLLSHQPGWNVLENVYMSNKTMYILTDDETKWPPLNLLTSSGYQLKWSDADRKAREPTEWDISFITSEEAKRRWGNRIMPVKDWTVSTFSKLFYYC